VDAGRVDVGVDHPRTPACRLGRPTAARLAVVFDFPVPAPGNEWIETILPIEPSVPALQLPMLPSQRSGCRSARHVTAPRSFAYRRLELLEVGVPR